MRSFSDRYVVTDRLLGSGAFGRVFMAIDQGTRTQVACKIVDTRLAAQSNPAKTVTQEPRPSKEYNLKAELAKVQSWANKKQIVSRLSVYFREFEILSSINHPNIIALDKVFVTDNNLYIFQELVTAGDLFSYLHSKNNDLTEVEAAVIIRQAVMAVQFLHDRNIAHRDLKPENIMMTALATGARIVLSDFGSARRVPEHRRLNTMAGSVQYGAPEMVNQSSKFFPTKKPGGYALEVDMWSLGVITALLLFGRLPFDDLPGQHNPSLASTADLRKLESSSRWRNLGNRPKDFIQRLLVLNEEERMNANEALEHTWFCNDVHKTDFEDLYQRTVKKWRPRVPNVPIIEFVRSRSRNIKSLECSQQVLNPSGSGRWESSRPRHLPVDPPYKPFPRKMHDQGGLWPKKRRTRGFSVEVEEAIKKNWSNDLAVKAAPGHDQINSSTSALERKNGSVGLASTSTLRKGLALGTDERILSRSDSSTRPNAHALPIHSETGRRIPELEKLVGSTHLPPATSDLKNRDLSPAQTATKSPNSSKEASAQFLQNTTKPAAPDERHPVPLNVCSCSKLNPRTKSSRGSGSISPSPSQSPSPSKRRTDLLFEHEDDAITASTSIESPRQRHHIIARSLSADETSHGVWPHCEHLRVLEDQVDE